MKNDSLNLMQRIIAFLIMLFLLICVFLVSANAASLIDVDPLLSKLESAFNRKDLADIIDCFEPGMAQASKDVTGIMGIDSNIYNLLLPFANGLFSAYASESSTWPTCRLTGISYEGDDYVGMLEYNVILTYTTGETENFNTTMDVRKVDGNWYIAAYQNSSLSDLLATESVNKDTVVYSDITATDLNYDIPFIYKVDSNLYYTQNDNDIQMAFINEDGKVVFQGYFQECGDEHDGRIPVEKKECWGLIDKRGQVKADFKYQRIEYAGSGYWKVYKDEGWGLIDGDDTQIIKCQYDKIGTPNEGYVPVQKENLWGLLDLKGNVVVQFGFTEMRDKVIHGLIGVGINRSYGLIDVSGKEVFNLSTDLDLPEVLDNGLIEIFTRNNGNGNDAYELFTPNGKKVYSYEKPQNPLQFEFFADSYVYVKTEYESHTILNSGGDIAIDMLNILQTQDKYITDYLLYPETYDGEWMAISLSKYTDNYFFGQRETASFLNFVDLSGKLKYSNSLLADRKDVFISDDHRTYVFPSADQIIILHDDQIYKVPAPKFCSYGMIGSYAFVTGLHSPGLVIDVESAQIYKYIDLVNYPSAFSTGKANRTYALVVSDGTYKGLITSKGLVGDGLKYISIDIATNNSRVHGSIQTTSNTFEFNVGKTGSIYIPNGTRNDSLVTIPLTAGEGIIFEPVTIITDTERFAAVNIEEFESFGAVTNDSNINVRETPSSKGRKLETIKKEGTKVIVTGQEEEIDNETIWYQVTLEDGTQGYIQSKYLDKLDAVPAEQTQSEQLASLDNESLYEPFYAVTTAANVNVREGPSKSTKRIGQIEDKGVTITVIDEATDNKNGKQLWYLIQLEDGQTGYILSDYIDKVE